MFNVPLDTQSVSVFLWRMGEACFTVGVKLALESICDFYEQKYCQRGKVWLLWDIFVVVVVLHVGESQPRAAFDSQALRMP